jgi:hypothetical protein
MSFVKKETNNKDDEENVLPWTPEQEELLAIWADKALCYRWLHDLAEKKYTRLNNFIQIPVIILSTTTGALNVGIDSVFPSSMKQYANMSLGGVSLLTGIISTVGNFLRYAQNMEAHRVASIQWSKFNRNIAAEVAIHPEQRQNAVDFFMICRAELDRLIEQSPSIPNDIILAFESKFMDVKISRPEVCNSLEPTKIYKASHGLDFMRTSSPTTEIAKKKSIFNLNLSTGNKKLKAKSSPTLNSEFINMETRDNDSSRGSQDSPNSQDRKKDLKDSKNDTIITFDNNPHPNVNAKHNTIMNILDS